MADIGQFVQKYSQYKSSFKATSFDSEHGTYLCMDDSQIVMDYDGIVASLYPNSQQRPKSFDALFVYGENIFCVEFKNQKPANIDNKEVQEKLVDGKKELISLLHSLNIQTKSYNFYYCVVYKKCIEPRDRYKCGIDKNAILFGLQKYKEQSLVKEIFTNNIEFFTKQFTKQLHKELAC
jgi:hypothetical protein